jgi:hypothetical protein
MSANILDQQPDQRLFTEHNEMKRQISEMRTIQLQGRDAVNLQNSGNYFGIPAGGGNITANTYLVFMFVLTNADDKQLFGTFHFTMYEDTAATVGKEIGYGSNSTIDNHWEWKYWRDWSTSGGAIPQITTASAITSMSSIKVPRPSHSLSPPTGALSSPVPLAHPESRR